LVVLYPSVSELNDLFLSKGLFTMVYYPIGPQSNSAKKYSYFDDVPASVKCSIPDFAKWLHFTQRLDSMVNTYETTMDLTDFSSYEPNERFFSSNTNAFAFAFLTPIVSIPLLIHHTKFEPMRDIYLMRLRLGSVRECSSGKEP